MITDDLTRVCIVDFNVAKKKGMGEEEASMDDMLLSSPEPRLKGSRCCPFEKEESFVMKSFQRGTLAFAAPERMGFSPYTEKVDLWAAGIVLYMLLIGEHPFEEEEDFSEEDQPADLKEDKDSLKKIVEKIERGEQVMAELLK